MTPDSPAIGVNRTNPDRWKADIALSVDMYNTWFMEFAPAAYRQTRTEVTASVEATLHTTDNLTNVSVALLKANPGVLPTLRMSICGYFDTGYLGYEAAEGIDWVWEHRIDELAKFGL